MLVLTSLSEIEQCREQHGASNEEEKQGAQGIHTPLDSNNHDLDGHNDCRRVLECSEHPQESEQSQNRKSKVHRLLRDSSISASRVRAIVD